MNLTSNFKESAYATRRDVEYCCFQSHDNTEIFYRYWPVEQPVKKQKAIVMFHRGHEHGGRMSHLADELQMPDTAFFAWDARGLGRSASNSDHTESLAMMVRDIDFFIKHICVMYGLKSSDIIVVGQSVGASILTTWVHDYAPHIRGMVLAAPAFRIKLYVPMAKTLIAFRQKIFGAFSVNSYVKAHHLTHDSDRIRSFNNDPLIQRPIASNVLLDLFNANERCIKNAHAIYTPTLTLVSSNDWVVDKKPQYEFSARLSSHYKRLIELPGFFHDTLGEKNREQALLEIRAFANTLFSKPITKPNLRDSDRQGQSFQHYESLKAEVKGLKKYYWKLLKKMIFIGAKLSKGYLIGQKTGFDSGSTLDYIYQNHPQGSGWIGKQIDKAYLNTIGWRGIRQRKVNIEILINQAIDRLQANEEAVRIVDLAAGHGRYLLDVIESRRDGIESFLLRDFSHINVETGNKALTDRRLSTLGSFELGDAFSQASIAEVQSNQTLAVISGLYELFSDNSLLKESLAGLSKRVQPGGYLIYTNQPWHPQQTLIARVLNSHKNNQPWVMRCRSQAEIDQLVEDAGFRKCDQLVDNWGIFTVSIAQRV